MNGHPSNGAAPCEACPQHTGGYSRGNKEALDPETDYKKRVKDKGAGVQVQGHSLTSGSSFFISVKPQVALMHSCSPRGDHGPSPGLRFPPDRSGSPQPACLFLVHKSLLYGEMPVLQA